MSSDSLKIRPATADDAPALASLLTQLGYPSEPVEMPGRLERLYSRPGAIAFVAEARDQVVGCITVHVFDGLHASEPTAWLTAVVVDEAVRGKGVGSALLKHAEEWAIEQGVRRVSLTSALRRTEAHEFYKARDYEHTGVRLTKIFHTHHPH